MLAVLFSFLSGHNSCFSLLATPFRLRSEVFRSFLISLWELEARMLWSTCFRNYPCFDFFYFSLFSQLCQNSFSSFLCRFSRSASGTGGGGSICEARGEFRSVGSQTFYLFLAFHIFISSLKAISSKLYLFLFRHWIVPFHSFYSFL